MIWPIFLLLGLEHVRIDPGNTVVTPLDFYNYPIAHSLVGCLGWGIGLGIVYWLVRKNSREALVVAAVTLSHWILDAVVHRPDLPVIPESGPIIGIGLWNSLIGTIVVELGIFALGLFLYLRSTRSKDRIGIYGMWGLMGFLILVWLGNIFGPPPPSDTAVAVSCFGLWFVVPWGYWVDRHRQTVGGDEVEGFNKMGSQKKYNSKLRDLVTPSSMICS